MNGILSHVLTSISNPISVILSQFLGVRENDKLTTNGELIELRLVIFQIEGKLPIISREDDKVKVNVSKHGIKVIDMKGQVGLL